ncbi:MAG: carboxymuconolactone decarboxylase family protein [Candidatus Hermodarchaeota archaeon]
MVYKTISEKRREIYNHKKGPRKSVYLSKPRIPPVEEPDWDDDTRNLIEGWKKLNNNAPAPNIMKTLGNYSKLYNRWRVFGNHILYKCSLPIREKELLILRVGWLCNSEYEWAQHSVIGKRAGLSDVEILRIRDGPDAEGWSPFDALLLRAVDELYVDSFISDSTWNELATTYDKHQLMDLIFTVGQYNLVSMVLNSLGLQLELGMKGFPKS